MKKFFIFLISLFLISSCTIVTRKSFYTNYPKSMRQYKNKRGACELYPMPYKERRRMYKY